MAATSYHTWNDIVLQSDFRIREGEPFDDSAWQSYYRYYLNEFWIGCKLLKPPPNIDEIDVTFTFTVACRYEYIFETRKRIRVKGEEENSTMLSVMPVSSSGHMHIDKDLLRKWEENNTLIAIKTKVEITAAYRRTINGLELIERDAENRTILSPKQQNLLSAGYVRMNLTSDIYRNPVELNDLINVFWAQYIWASAPKDAINGLLKSGHSGGKKRTVIRLDKFTLDLLDAQLCIRANYKKRMIKAYLAVTTPPNIESVRCFLTVIDKRSGAKIVVDICTFKNTKNHNRLALAMMKIAKWRDLNEPSLEYAFYCDILSIKYNQDCKLENYYKPIRMKSISEHKWSNIKMVHLNASEPGGSQIRYQPAHKWHTFLSEPFNNGTWIVQVYLRRKYDSSHSTGLFIRCALIRPPLNIYKLGVRITFSVGFNNQFIGGYQDTVRKRLILRDDEHLDVTKLYNLSDVTRETLLSINTKVEIIGAWTRVDNDVAGLRDVEMQKCGIQILTT